LVFGQFLRQRPFSFLLALAGIGLWFVFIGIRRHVVRKGKTMTGVLVLFGGIALILAIIALLDWIAQRKDRRSEHRPPA
jgi:hypothetical protein